MAIFFNYMLALSHLFVVVYSGQSDFDPDYPDRNNPTYTDFNTVNKLIKNIILEPLGTINLDVIPHGNMSDSLEVTMDFSLLSVTNFNEISGEINLVVFLRLSWTAVNLPKWNENLLAGRKSLTVSSKLIWTPRLYVLNPTSTVKDLTSVSQNLRISNNGTVSWDIITGIEAACAVDVTNFPFDTQTCSVSIAPWGYDSTEVRVNGKIDTSKDFLFTQNSAWSLSKTKIESVNLGEEWPYLKVSLEISRLYEYFLINVLAPPILLSILSPCVFLLPASSGERMSYAITCFLAFSVFMSMLSDNMPKSSVPVAHLSYFMLYMLVHSCGVTVTTVFTLRVYHKAETGKSVPRWLQVAVNVMRLQFCVNRRSQSTDEEFNHEDVEISETPVEQFTKADATSRHGSIELKQMYIGQKYVKAERYWKDSEVTWCLVGKTLDWFFFIGYLSWMLFIVISFLAQLGLI